jgi:two-component system response regulator RegA
VTNSVDEQFDNPKLLLVDDDEVFCQVLSRALIKREFQVEVAHSQDQAVEIAKKFHPDLAIVDLRIDIESGLNMVRTLVDMEPGIRIVVLTGYASISPAVESIKLGAIHYLTKPAEVDEIVQALYRDQGNRDLPLTNRPMSPKRIEWEHLQKVLNDHDGNISAAARAMGMHRRSLQRKLNKKPITP